MSEALFDVLMQGYEATLRECLSERLKGEELELLPRSSTDRKERDRNIGLYTKALYNDERRKVQPVPRQVFLSDRFADDRAQRNYEPKLGEALALLEAGSPNINDPANQFLSPAVEYVFKRTRSGRVKRDEHDLPVVSFDYMLYDWGIYHFHIEPGRGDALLFALLRKRAAYILRIGRHEQDFDYPAILQVVHRNWPELVPGIDARVESEFGAPEVNALRRHNVSFAVDVAGRAVQPLEFRATDGTPVHVTRGRDFVAHQLRHVAGGLDAGAAGWAAGLIEQLGGHPDEAQFVLRFSTPFPSAFEVLLRRGGSGPWYALRLPA